MAQNHSMERLPRRSTNFARLAASGCLLVMLSLFASELRAADQNVNSTGTSSSTPGTLPYAVANVISGENVIFQSTVADQTISLTTLNVPVTMNWLNSSGGAVTVDFSNANCLTVATGAELSVAADLTLSANQANAIYVINNFSGDLSLGNINGSINGVSSTANAFSIRGETSLSVGDVTGDIYANAYQSAFGMFTTGNLLAGDISGTVTVESTTTNAHAVRGVTGVDIGNITGTVSASGGGKSVGVFSNQGSVETDAISGSIMVNSSDADAYGISGNTGVTVGGAISSDISASGYTVAYGIYSETGSVSTDAITADSTIAATSSISTACGIFGRNDVTVAGDMSGTIYASGSDHSYGILADNGDALITGAVSGSITAISSDFNAFGIRGATGLTVGDVTGDIYANAYQSAFGMFTTSNLLAGDITGSINVESTTLYAHAVRGTTGVDIGNIIGTISASGGDKSTGVLSNQGSVATDAISGTITVNSSGADAYGISGYTGVTVDGEIVGDISASGSTATYGIYSETGSVSTGSIGSIGSISAISSTDSAYGISGYSGVTTGDISGTMIVSGVNDSYGLYAEDGSVETGTISGSISTTSSGDQDYGIWSSTGVTVDGDISGTISASGVNQTYGICANSGVASITGGISGTIAAISSSDNAFGIRGDGGVTVNGDISGDITINGNHSGFGIFSTNTVSTSDISGSVSIVSSTLYAHAVRGVNGVTVGDVTGDISASGVGMSSGIYSNSGSVSTGAIGGTITAASSTSNAAGIRAETDVIVDGGISGMISANASTQAYGVRSDTGSINGSSSALELTGTVSATGGNAYAFSAAQGVNLFVGDSATVSGVSNTGTGDAYSIYNSGVYDSQVEMVAGCSITGDIELGGAADVMTLSGTTGSTTLNDDLINVETITQTGGTWDIEGNIIDPCDFTVTGGTLVMNGIGTETLLTNGPAGLLMGTGTVLNLYNYGTFKPGNSIDTFHVLGDYVNYAGSNLEIEINDAGECDRIEVGGTATLEGGTVNVLAESGNYTDDMRYTFLTAEDGVTGTYAGVTDNIPNLTALLGYGTDYAEIYFIRDATNGEVYASLATVGIESNEQFLRTIARRLRSRDVCRTTCCCPCDCCDKSCASCCSSCGCRSDWTSWAEGFGGGASIGGNGDISGLNYSLGGLAFGMERQLNDITFLGVAGGYTNAYTSLDARNDRGTIDSGNVALYAQRSNGRQYLTGIAAYGYNSYAVNRELSLPTLNFTPHSSFGGSNFSFYTEVGSLFNARRAIQIQPYAALEYIQLHENGFSESGSGAIDVVSGGMTADAFRSFLGTRVVANFTTRANRLMVLEGRVAWRHEFLDEERILDGTFGPNQVAFSAVGANVDRDVAILGTGLNCCLSDHTQLFANYDILTSNNYTAHAGTGGLVFTW